MTARITNYGNSFNGTNGIYNTNRSKFGTETDFDGNNGVIIVFSRVLSGGLLGYFYAVDKFPNLSYPDSNEGDIIYITTSSYSDDIINGAISHEFQHMIYFDEHRRRGVSATYTWLNEALSQAAEYYNNYLTNHNDHMKNFLSGDWDGVSLTHWTSIANYGYGAIFIRYLIDRFGDAAIYNMCSTNKVGIAAVEEATSTDFNTIFNDFSIALVLDGTGESADPRYNFSTLDLPSLQAAGRGGLETSYSYGSGTTVSSSGGIPPYMITFFRWTGSFGSMNLTGTEMVCTAFGLSE
jgi:hypothetical protein